eukprot:5573828-Amphidinium_carterae.1
MRIFIFGMVSSNTRKLSSVFAFVSAVGSATSQMDAVQDRSNSKGQQEDSMCVIAPHWHKEEMRRDEVKTTDTVRCIPNKVSSGNVQRSCVPAVAKKGNGTCSALLRESCVLRLLSQIHSADQVFNEG